MSRQRNIAERFFRDAARLSAVRDFITIGLLVLVFLFTLTSSAVADPVLEIRPITWNIIGLDSNSPATGPYRFPVGARVCNTGTTDANNVTAAFLWDDGQGVFVGDVNADDYINLRAGSLSSITIGSLTASSCSDAYFEVEVTKVAAAFDNTRRYHITATDSVSGVTGSSPQPRELYVEHLISQNRNSVSDIRLNGVSVPAGGSMTLMVGNTYTISLYGGTATQGYEQFQAFINFPNTIFQILSVSTTYSADSSGYVSNPNDKLYADACLWENDPDSPNYRSCVGVDPLTGKAGGSNVVTTYMVKILSGAGTSQTLNSLLYDFSGSSFHYNADYGVGARIINILGPSSVTIGKSFSPKAISPGGTSTMTFKLTNPTTETFTDVNFTDSLQGGLAAHSTPDLSYSGCGSSPSPSSLSGGATSLSFSNITLSPNGICTISLTVTAPAGTYPNTTGNLFINTSVDTGNTGSDTLTASSAPACTPGQTLATWTVPSGATAPPDTGTANPTINNTGFTATSYHFPLAKQSVVTGNQSPNRTPIGDDTSWNTWGYQTDGGYVEFAVDTRNYSGVSIAFYVYPDTNGPKTLTVTIGATTVATYTSPGTLTLGAWNTKTIDLSAYASTTGTTTVRITGTGANNDNSGSNMFLDDISFSGCAIPAPAPTISKSFSPDTIEKGSNSTLSFTINNTQPGNKNLTGIAFADVLPAGLSISDSVSPVCGGTLTTTAATRTISLTEGSLAAGASCYPNITVTGAIEGIYENVSGFISSNESGNNNSSNGYATDSLTVIAPPDLEKSFSPASILVGQTSTLTFSIANLNQTISLSGIGFTDTLLADLTVANSGPTATCGGSLTTTAPSTISFSGGSLAANTSCSFDVTVTGSAVGSWENTTSAVTSAEGGDGSAATATLVVSNPQPLLGLNKQVSTDGTNWFKFVGVSLPGDIYYRFTVSNDGETALSSISVTDPDVTPCVLPSSLAIDASASCVVGPLSVTSIPTPNPFINTATADSASTNPVSSSARYGTKSLSLDKSADPTEFNAAGELLTYSYLVTNNGGYPLLGPVTVSDDKSSNENCPSVITVGDLDNYVDPGESITCTATYTVQAAEVTAGFVTNTASATAEGVTSNTDSETVIKLNPALSIVKSASPATYGSVGAVINYSYLVTNSGNVTLSGPFTVSDDRTTNESCPVTATLAPGASITCTSSYTITQADLDSGSVTNIASATNGAVTSPTDTETVTAVQTPSLTVVKSASPATYGSVGTVINYSYLVTNSGNVILSGPFSVSDNRTTNESCPPTASLAPGASITCTSSYTITQADLNTGSVTNIASATNGAVTSPTDTETVTAVQSPALTIVKSASPTTYSTVGTLISYSYLVTNSGNITLSGPFTVNDNKTTNESCPVTATLAPGASITCTSSYTITQADLDAGSVTNIASATNGAVTSPTDTETVTAVQTPSLTVVKSASPATYNAVGTVISYNYLVTNTGNVTLNGPFTVTDDRTTNESCPVTATLAPGASITCTSSYTITQADLDAGSVTNIASATNGAVTSPTDTETVTAGEPSLFDPPSGSKTLNADGYPELVWRMVWINNGNANAVGVVITDDIPDNTSYVSGSLVCDPRGASSTSSCTFDSGNNRIIWEGTVAADPGALNETQANNEVVITFRTTMSTSVTRVENQGCAQIPGGDTSCTDDPSTSTPGDPTVWRRSRGAAAVPTMNEWGMIILLLLQGLAALYFLRRRVRN